MGDEHEEVTLPSGTVDLRTELVPVVQRWLAQGLTPSFIRACVRIEGFEPFSGGLKADLVGGLKIGLRSVLKLGGPELQWHARLMQRANEQRPGSCVEVVDLARLDDDRWLMMMGQLRATTLHDAVYSADSADDLLERSVAKLFEALAAVQAVPWVTADGFARTADPFQPRIRPRLAAQWQALPQWQALLCGKGGTLALEAAARPCPPLDVLLQRLETWLDEHMPNAPSALIHGDPHLRNAMIVRYGRGIAVRLIDPNPEHGYTDPAYDHGKLLHFAEPVGWALEPAERSPCRAELTKQAGGWQLRAWLDGEPKAAERRRRLMQGLIERGLQARLPRQGPQAAARLAVARASAHLGLLSRMKGHEDQNRRLFVLAHALAAMCDWHDLAHAA